MAHGFFITFEGGEGSGKSTQAVLLADALRGRGREVSLTREPGGAPGAEAIRDLLVSGATGRWSPLAEALLFSAARDEHLHATIRPALQKGAIVICDRFADSTRAYQGGAGGLDPEVIDTLERWVVGTTQPDLTYMLDLDAGTGLHRAQARATGEDRFERMDHDFHNRLRRAYLEIAAGSPERCIVIDANRQPEEIAAEIERITLERLARVSAGTGP